MGTAARPPPYSGFYLVRGDTKTNAHTVRLGKVGVFIGSEMSEIFSLLSFVHSIVIIEFCSHIAAGRFERECEVILENLTHESFQRTQVSTWMNLL